MKRKRMDDMSIDREGKARQWKWKGRIDMLDE
jgi:hypothetical protein